VLACGRLWDEAKRLRILDGIARDLPWRVYIAGESTSPEGATIAARQAVGLGQLSADELGLWMQRASIFVHPACYEPFGLSVLEAALAGCALLLANLSSLRELWDEAAVFVDAGDEQALRAALFELIHDRGRRLQLGRAARARAARFSTAAMARAYAELYRELLPQSMSDELSSTEIAAV
jgi:glycosyltransferase involved in cell wall biosynthesis